MKHIFYLLCGWGFCWGLQAQPTITFATFHDLSPWVSNRGISVENLPNGYAFSTLHAETPTPGSVANTGLGITDLNGKLLHQKVLRNFNGEGIRYRPQDSTFLIWGERYLGPGNYNIVLIKATFRGDTIWAFEHDLGKFDLCRHVIELPDGSFMMHSATYQPNGGINIVKVSNLGKMLWTKEYISDAFLWQLSGGIIKMNDSTVLFNGIGKYGGIHEGVHLYSIDFDGKVLWDSAHLISTYQGGAAIGQLRRLSNGRIIASAIYEELGPAGCYNGCASFIEVLPESHTVRKVADYPNDHINQTINNFSATLDGNIVACGVGGFEVYGKWDAYVLISKISPDGQFIWERWLPKSLMHDVGDVKATPDGGCIVIGTQQRPRPGGGYEFYAALVKLDGNGCLEPNCDSLLVTSPVWEVPKEAPAVLLISPNPAREQFSVTLSAPRPSGLLRVVSMLGAVLREVPVSGSSVVLNVEGLPAGVYWVQHIEEGLLQAVGKVVVAY